MAMIFKILQQKFNCGKSNWGLHCGRPYVCVKSYYILVLIFYSAFALLAIPSAVLAIEGFRPSVRPLHSGVLSR